MTRICEKFIEEITSGSGSVSDELKQHLASCSACREAFESVRQLKDARKPMTGKEAASIAGILKAVQTGASSPAATSSGATTGAGSMILKPLILALCLLSVIGVMILQNKTPETMPETPTNGITTAIETKTESVTAADVDENTDLNDNVAAASATTDAVLTTDTIASSSLTDDSAQVDVSSGEAQTISVSPDQEDIKLH